MLKKNEVHNEATTIPNVKEDCLNKIIVKEGKNNIIDADRNINIACSV